MFASTYPSPLWKNPGQNSALSPERQNFGRSPHVEEPLGCITESETKVAEEARAARFGIDASLMDEMYRLEIDDARRVPSNIDNLDR
jgi:hypothetical protein